MTTRELREAAATYLLQYGWTQGELRDGRGRCCLVGALQRVTDDAALVDEARRELHTELRASGGGGSLFWWNDHRARSVDDVVALLRGDRAQAAPPQ